jgi:predicted nucleic acid-binding Zn ribbon protein
MSREVMPIGDVLKTVLRRLGLGQRVRVARIVQDWERIVGSKIAKHCTPVSVRGKILVVNVDSSVWLAELTQFFKDKMLEQIRNETGGTGIKDIRFRIGDIETA